MAKSCGDADTRPEMVYTLTVVGHDDYDFIEVLRRMLRAYDEDGDLADRLRFEHEGTTVTAIMQAATFIED